MSSTICKFLADDVRGNGRLLSYCLETTKCDLNWKPNLKGSGRSMLEQADEIAKLNHGLAVLLKGGEAKLSDEPMITDGKQAANAVMESANALAATLDNMQDSELEKMVTLPFGTYPARFAAGIANANMVYHWGQANYIEMLDGDSEFRIPPEFVNN